MKRGGLGGAEIQPVYPLALDDPAGRGVNMRSSRRVPRCAARGQRACRCARPSARSDARQRVAVRAPRSASAMRHRLRLDKIVVGPGARAFPRPAMTPARHGSARLSVPRATRRSLRASMQWLAWPDGAGAVTLTPFERTHVSVVFLAGRTGMQVKRPALAARLCVESLRIASTGSVSRPGRRAAAETVCRPPAFCDFLRQPGGYDSDWRRLRRRVCDAPRVRRDTAPAAALGRSRIEGAMVREDWDARLPSCSRAVHRAAWCLGARTAAPAAHAGVGHPAGDRVEQ